MVYRRSVDNDVGEWKVISNGLPEPRGTIIAMLAAAPKNKGEFYAIKNRGVFCSTDTGLAWRELDVSQIIAIAVATTATTKYHAYYYANQTTTTYYPLHLPDYILVNFS